VRDGVARRLSSADPNWESGFFDFRPVLPGQTIALADIQGPGIIRHIWTTSRSFEPAYLRLLTLRMYWDDETSPSVECPLGDFFGVGHGLDLPLQSHPVSDTSGGVARNVFWPMPFRHRARITLTNEGREQLPIFYFNIDWERVPSLPADTAYFHAWYHQEYPTRVGRRYTVANIEGRGHYVGTVLSVRQWFDGWYGEGDDLFFLDGDSEPALRGTGTEDYFCNAWGFDPVCTDFYGAPLFEGTRRGDRTSVYRWHIPDPIGFNTSLRFELEHNGDMTFPTGEQTATDRSDDYASVAFWYQAEPHKPWPPIPQGYDRIYPPDPPDSPFDPRVGDGFSRIWLKTRLDGKKAALTVVPLPEPVYRGGNAVIQVPNPTEAPLRLHSVFRQHAQLRIQPLNSDVDVPPGQARQIKVDFLSDEPRDVRALDPAVADWTCSFLPEGRAPIDVSFQHTVLFDAPFPCEPAPNPIAIDGQLDDWPGGLPYVCRQPVRIREQVQSWTGPADASFQFALAHDDSMIYLAAEVTDDDPVQDPTGDNPLQDTVMVQFAPAGGNQIEGENLSLTLNASVTPDNLRQWMPFLPEQTRFAWRATPGGYALELAIPADWLDRAEGAPWTAFRFNLALFDFDAGVLVQLWWRPAWHFAYNSPGTGVFLRK